MRPRLWTSLILPLAVFVVAALVIGCGGAGGGASAAGGSAGGSSGGGSGGSSGGGSGGSSGGGSGGGSGGSGGGSGGGSTGGELQIVPSTIPGIFEAQFLTGIGRGLGNYEVEVGRIELQGSSGSLLSGFSPTWINLDLYTNQKLSMGGPASPTTIAYNQFVINFTRLQEAGGALFPGPVNKAMACNVRLSRGRTTAAQLFLDATMFEPNGANMSFTDVIFDSINTDPYGGALPAFFTDMLRFDISGLVSRPTLEAGGQATQVYVSGDLVGLSGNSGSGFEAIFDFERNIDALPIRSGTATPGATAGNYTVQQADPFGSATPIPRLTGGWQNADEVVLNMGAFVALALPSANPLLPDHFILVARNEQGAITDFWLGALDGPNGFFYAFPLGELKLFRSTQIVGTVQDGQLGGSFAIVAGPRPSSFPATGTYLRYLR